MKSGFSEEVLGILVTRTTIEGVPEDGSWEATQFRGPEHQKNRAIRTKSGWSILETNPWMSCSRSQYSDRELIINTHWVVKLVIWRHLARILAWLAPSDPFSSFSASSSLFSFQNPPATV
jgi:hypothetical protein